MTLPKRVTFDACSLIAFFNGEKGCEVVLSLLNEAKQGKLTIFLHSINLCEVYYDCFRVSGKKAAGSLLEKIWGLPITIVQMFDKKLLRLAGELKATQRISFADAIALGLSKKEKTFLVTSDHSEFGPLEQKEIGKYLWIR